MGEGTSRETIQQSDATARDDDVARVETQVSVVPESERKLKPFQFLLTPHFWIIFFHGQLLSLSIVATNTFTTFLANEGNSIPAFQSLFNYAILALVFTPFTWYKYGFKRWFKLIFRDGWKYFFLAFADVEGNYFVVKAYAYTNILSAALLDNFAIVVVVILSFFLLKVRYHWSQIIAIVVCIGGMALLVVSDYLTDKDYPAVDMVKGDLFVLLGAACYGISNVGQEYLVSKRPVYEFLGQLGFWGVFINGVQAAIFERESLREAQWTSQVGGYFAGYTLCLLFLYLTCPFLMRMSSAAFYNLSLLTSDFWSLLIGIRVFGYFVYWLYPVGFVFIILGMIFYHAAPRSRLGEAVKPWLGKNQEKGISGIGTAKRAKEHEAAVLEREFSHISRVSSQGAHA